MSELTFQLEWVSPGGARGPELRATWARLGIAVGDHVVTQVEDQLAGSMREAVYGPLYPVAEWIVNNWWTILYEISAPHRSKQNDYRNRHNLSAAAEGFALPSLTFEPEGLQIQLSWSPRELPAARVSFRSQGRQYMDRSQVEEALADFVTRVLARLEARGCPGTPLAGEWRAVQLATRGEKEFCRIAGRLGLDPFALTAVQTSEILSAAHSLPKEVYQEFFASARSEQLSAQANAVCNFIDESKKAELPLSPLPSLRTQQPFDACLPPWEQGYRYARELRQRLSLKNGFMRTEADVAAALRVDAAAWQDALGGCTDKLRFLDGLMAVNKAGGPCFVLTARLQQSRTFALCRALFEYLYAADVSAALLAPVRSDRQKRNRAFAAEFLVPAALLKARIKNPVLTEEEVEDIAEEFGVSGWIVRHQIENHCLASLVQWTI